MKQDLNDPRFIEKILEIAVLSKTVCLFYADHADRPYEATLRIFADTYFADFQSNLPSPMGILVIRAFTLQFKARVALIKDRRQKSSFSFEAPKQLETHDPRKFTRIPVAPGLTKVAVIRKLGPDGIPLSSDLLGTQNRFRGTIQDLSAGGICIKLSAEDPFFGKEAPLSLTFTIFGLTVDCHARVVDRLGSKIRCRFHNIGPALRDKLDQRILTGLTGMLEKHHRELKTFDEAKHHLKELEEEKHKSGELKHKQKLEENFISLINPILESTVSVISAMSRITPIKKEVRLERICNAIYDVSAQISFKGPKVEGNVFLCLKKSTALALGSRILDEWPEELDDNVKDMVGEICNIIVGNSKKKLSGEDFFRLSTPTLIVGKEHLVAVLSKFPVIRLMLDSEIGPIDLNLYVDEIKEKLGETYLAAPANFAYKKELILPILNATENIFQNYLMLETRKKGVVIQEKLSPKFQLSAMLDVFAKGLQGKVLLNISDRLALKIHHGLLGEEKKKVDEGVRDAVGEMVNIITGNAKAEFSKMNLVYQLSTPYVVYGRDHIISNAGNNPFISSVYWTNEGFFEICLSFQQIKEPS